MARKLLLFSYSCFSDESANGITMKNLLSEWRPEEKAEFFCEPQAPDFSAAHHYFRVTDVQAIKSFFGKKSRHIFTWQDDSSDGPDKPQTAVKNTPKRIPQWLKKYKYNFVLKWLREYFWILGPWGKKNFWSWVKAFSPDVIFYMVGESIFMDRLVLDVCRRMHLPLVLYNSEAYRIIDLHSRKGLERAYYRKTEKLYEKLAQTASLIFYNSEMLRMDYEKRYPISARGIIVYNSAQCGKMPYEPNETVKITYFGNLGVGRSEELLRTADVIKRVDRSLILDIYGKATQAQAAKFQEHPNIQYHGFVDAVTLRDVIAESDILLHVETFDQEKIPKLKYAFSTKIAQCLCSGRCFVSFAPKEIASSQYLLGIDGVSVASSEEALEQIFRNLIRDPVLRKQCADKAYQMGQKNHQICSASERVWEEIGMIIHETEAE